MSTLSYITFFKDADFIKMLISFCSHKTLRLMTNKQPALKTISLYTLQGLLLPPKYSIRAILNICNVLQLQNIWIYRLESPDFLAMNMIS